MGKFTQGQSGNPGGRPKSKELRSLCRTYTADAVKELGRLALKAKGEMTRVVAIRELLDRGYGRPLQGLEVSVDDRTADHVHHEPLMPAEVAAELSVILTSAERELGISPGPNQSNQERLTALLAQSAPLPPDLYRALQEATGTVH